MTTFDRAMLFVAAEEGGWADHEWDRGGRTRYGISSAAFPKVDLETLTPDGAKQLLYEEIWLKLRCDVLPWPLCLAVFDFGVHSGWPTAARQFQRLVGTKADGIIGEATLRAVRGHDACMLTQLFLHARGRFVADIWRRDATQLAAAGGWVKRLINLGIEVGRS